MNNIFYENRDGFDQGYYIDFNGDIYGPYSDLMEAQEDLCWMEYELEKEARELSMYEDDPVAYRIRNMYEQLY